MGVYLNSAAAYALYENESEKPYFVDKTRILETIIPLVEQGANYVCITRPRRFGKTIMANMLASFFSRGCDAAPVFERLEIAKTKGYGKHLNRHNVIHISFNKVFEECESYKQYIGSIKEGLLNDLQEAFPGVGIKQECSLQEAFQRIFLADSKVRFLFILDEWDYIFHQNLVTETDKEDYLRFLNTLLKDQPYVSFAYLTGILPIAKYSSGSELNMFIELTMASEPMFSAYFGFTEPEVDELYERYAVHCPRPRVTRGRLRIHTEQGADGSICGYAEKRAFHGLCLPAGKGVRAYAAGYLDGRYRYHAGAFGICP